jgi:D-tyrosyl-tRNA(Tyr) deacylase
MRAVVQRVTSASVTVHGAVHGAIGPGLVALVGVGPGDSAADVEWLCAKLRTLRVFEDDGGKMNRSVEETRGSVLLVSQFTVYGDCRKGRRPSFDGAAPPELGERLFNALADALRAAGLRVQTGVFRASMQVALVNDGPVTLLLDSAKLF